MALKIMLIDLAEKELEDLLFNSPDLIEPNLKMLARQFPTDSGPLDLLGLDEDDGTLVVCELKVKPDELHLDQGMRYYDWCRENIAWLHKSYPDIETENPPRLILISPSFHSTVKRVARYLQEVVGLRFLEYQAIQDANGEKGLVLRKLVIEPPSIPTTVNTIPQIMGNLADTAAKAVLTDAHRDLTAKGIELRPLTNNWISLWYNSKRFAYLGVKKKFFVVEVITLENTWAARQRIRTLKEWQVFCQNAMQPILKQLESGK
jgi:hypothetical protein